MALFERVVREGSFTKAADRLGLSKSTVSDRITKLEARLEVRLLERTTRQLRPTDIGAAYYERCALIVAQAEDADDIVQSLHATPTGRLKISSPGLLGRAFLGPIIAAYMKRYPEVRVELLMADHRVDLVKEAFDLVIRVGPLEDSSLVTRRLCTAYNYCVASPSFLSAHGRPRTPPALGDFHCLMLRPRDIWRFPEYEPVKIRPRLVMNSMEMLKDAAIEGLGIAYLPSFLCADPLKHNRLVRLFPRLQGTETAICAVLPGRRFIPPKTQQFLEILSEMLMPFEPLSES